MNLLKELQDKAEFREKNKRKDGLTVLWSQSTKRYTMLKDEQTKTYYIQRGKDKKKACLGNNDDCEDWILYGILANKEDLKTLKFE